MSHHPPLRRTDGLSLPEILLLLITYPGLKDFPTVYPDLFTVPYTHGLYMIHPIFSILGRRHTQCLCIDFHAIAAVGFTLSIHE